MKELEEKIVNFAKERDWLQFNTPENLAKWIKIWNCRRNELLYIIVSPNRCWSKRNYTRKIGNIIKKVSNRKI